MPQRIQMRRSKGWRKPEGAVYVGRPSRWGNPFTVGAPEIVVDTLGGAYWVPDGDVRKAVVELFELHIGPMGNYEPDDLDAWVSPLAGRDLVCWCPLDQPCHADVLLVLANSDTVHDPDARGAA